MTDTVGTMLARLDDAVAAYVGDEMPMSAELARDAAETIRALQADKAMLTGQLQASRAMLAASPQGEGSSADTHPPQPDALPGDLRETVARLIAKPGVFSLDNEEAHRAASPRAVNFVRGDALAKADAILSLIQSERGGA